jgi:hypothetical protein
MLIEKLFNSSLVFVYCECDDALIEYRFNFEDIKEVIQEHNKHFKTDYKTINEFNNKEEYRTIKIL